MIPAIGPSSEEQPTNQQKMYELKSLSNFQGIRKIPTTPVMSPPVRKEIRLGRWLERSFEGDGRLAATLVFSVASSSATRAIIATIGCLNARSRKTGYKMASPKITADADVTATPMNAYSVIAIGNPSACPTICARCDLAYRVKSGIFNATVDQKPTIPVSAGMKNRTNSDVLRNLLGVCSTGPNPPALRVIQKSSSKPTTSIKGAPIPSRNLMVSSPRQMTIRLIPQNTKKQPQPQPGTLAAPAHTMQNTEKTASPPIQA